MGLVCVFWGKGGPWSQELCDSSKWSCRVAAAGQHLPLERRFLPLLGPGPTAPAKIQEALVKALLILGLSML